MKPITIRRLREKHHWTQQRLARAASLHRVTITRAETGGEVSEQTKHRIAKAFGVKPDAIAWGVRGAWFN